MIHIGNYGTKADSTTTTKVSSGGNSGQNNFNPVYLWGQYFDDSSDIDGSMTVKGDLEVSGKITAGEMAIDELNVENLQAESANIKDLESANFKAEKAELVNALINELSAGNAVMENLTVTKGAYFFELIIDKIKSAGGAVLFTPADGFKVEKVVEEPALQQVTLYFRSRDRYDKEIRNMWQRLDQARCQNFNKAQEGTNQEISNKYFWALVKNTNNELNNGKPVKVDIGTDGKSQIEECHYIILSTVEGEFDGTVNPEVGDDIVMLGHRGNDIPRQSAIYIASYASIDEDLKAPLFVQYAGINDFNLWTHKFNWFSAGLTAQGTVRGISASTISGDVKIGGSSIEDVINSKIVKTYRLLPNTNTIVYTRDGSLSPDSITMSIIVNDNGEVENLYTVPDMMKAEFYGVKGQTNNLLASIDAGSPIQIASVLALNYNYIYCQLKATTNDTIYDRCSVSVISESDVEVINGGHWEFAYKLGNDKPQKPADGTTIAQLSNGWSKDMLQPNITYKYVYMSQCFVSGSGTYGVWSDPLQLNGEEGKAGEDGKEIEFIYARTENELNRPNKPTINQTDDWHGTVGGVTWTDNPQGVTKSLQCEWVSMRTKVDKIWSAYSTPAIWSKWGEKGMDGDGYEYIYKAFAGETVDNPNNATRGKVSGEGAWISSTNQDTTDEYIPEGWYDEPVALTQENQKVWLSTRKKKNGENWSKFSEPTIWAHWAPKGIDGGSWVFAYQKSKTQPTKPTDNSAASSPWSTTMPTLSQSEIENGYSIWMTQCFVNGKGTYQTWSTPIPITGQAGKAGEDGKEIEFVYARTNSSTQINAPDTIQTDDWYGTSNGNTWTDNPKGVTESLQYEWVSMRSKVNRTWSAYSTPAIWSKWGEKGMDGDGYEYIYKRQSSSTAPSTPYMSNYATNSAYQTDGYRPSGWENNPQEVNSEFRYCFVSTRKKHDGIWQQFTAPVLWSQYSTKGSDGGMYAFIYKNSKDNPGKPSSNVTLDNLSGWSKEPTTPPSGQYTWMSQCFIGGDGQYGSWSTPIKITGEDGQAGKDGMSINFIYQRTNSNNKPSAPTYSSLPNSQYQTDDDYLGGTGTKWTKSPTGVDKDNQYEYVATRTKENGLWGQYTVALWSKWGEKGMDGDGYEYIYKRQSSSTAPSTPYMSNYATNSAYQTDGYEPAGWKNNPEEVNSEFRYCYVSTRKKHDGIWQQFTTPVLWSQYSTKGSDGGRYAFIYKNSKDNPGKPSNNVTLDNLSGWSKEPTTPPSGQYTWMSQCFISGDGKYGSWSTPIKITGEDGEAGKDGMSINFIYQRTNSSSKPSAPTYSSNATSDYQTNDDYLGGSGTKWTKSPTGVDKDNQYEYVATRTKENGLWGQYTVALWSKWGEQGIDGDGVEYIFKLSGTNSYGTHPKSITKSAYNDSTHGKNKNEDDFVPEGWTDNPQAISQVNQYLFVSTRKGHKGAWSAFSDPKLWAQYVNATNGTNGTNGTDGQNANIDYMVDNGCYAEIKYNTSTKAFTVDWKIDVFIVHVDGSKVTTVSSSTTPKLSDFTIKWKWNNSGETTISGTTASANGVSWSASDSRKFMLVTLYNSNGKKLDQLSIPVLLKSEATINVIQGQKAEITQTVTGNVKTELNFDGTIKDVKNSISRISQKCDSIESTVDDLDGEVSSIRQTSSSISLSVNNIKNGLSKCGIDIDAYKIKMNANTLEFKGLTNGSTAFTVTNSDGKEIAKLSSANGSHGRFSVTGANTGVQSWITLQPQTSNTLFNIHSGNSDINVNANGGDGTLRIQLGASNAVYIRLNNVSGSGYVPLILENIRVADGTGLILQNEYVTGQLVADKIDGNRYALYIKKS